MDEAGSIRLHRIVAAADCGIQINPGNGNLLYTQSLLSVVPSPYPREVRRQILAGELPDAADIPTGCRFHPRCPKAQQDCKESVPELLISSGPDGHGTACWLVDG